MPMSMSASDLASINVDDRYDDGFSVTKTTANLNTEGSFRAPFDVLNISDPTVLRAADRLGEKPPYRI